MSFVSRQHRRQRMAMSGKLQSADDETATQDCKLVDMSVGGARVEAHLTDQCRSCVLAVDKFGKFRAQVVWKKAPYVGLKFNESEESVAEVLIGMAVYG
ncbi:MAG: PilZ domain-containing protein [Alphaproteobacteria bacterium]|nr:PilZ domain-containing protein [Alphaproteobacteria bacterium]MBF0250578.1 PilZ domain-containing protein [Alphaproteobacteria bacterium]